MRSLIGTLLNRTPVPFVPEGGSGIFGLFGAGRAHNEQTEQLRSMRSVGTVFSVVNALARAASAPEWHMHRLMRPGTGDNCPKCDATDVTLVDDHLALRIWNKPNDFHTGRELRHAGQQHRDLTGETWLLVERDERARGLPLGLWTVRPDRLEIVPSAQQFIAGYLYHGPSGEQIPLELDEVILSKSPDPEDPYRGLGPIQSIMRDLDSARFGSEWNRRFFLNSAEPGGIIQTERRLSETEWKELTTRWREGHRGVANAHRVAVLEGHTWVPNAFSPRDIQFAQLRQVSRDTILEAFGMSKFGIGIVDDVNRATASAATAWFASQLAIPRLEDWKTMANTRFLPMFGQAGKGVELAYSDPVPPDLEAQNAERQSRTEAFKTLIDAGADSGEAADYVGLPRMTVTRPQTASPQTASPQMRRVSPPPFVPRPRR